MSTSSLNKQTRDFDHAHSLTSMHVLSFVLEAMESWMGAENEATL